MRKLSYLDIELTLDTHYKGTANAIHRRSLAASSTQHDPVVTVRDDIPNRTSIHQTKEKLQ